MADASDSKSDEVPLVWVQVPSPASRKKKVGQEDLPFFFLKQSVPCPLGQGLRSASVGAKQTSTGRLAPHLLHDFIPYFFVWCVTKCV